ncbi:SseB family protein [Lacticaseibacillus absianus]|uniref:SseB family protein n=1 Tax=Lacticaseibacillus absianus TaxID=2729623 RepID=UPI0015CAB4D3|nr:SseB family protein [Lacticaseibacillus absianus]
MIDPQEMTAVTSPSVVPTPPTLQGGAMAIQLNRFIGDPLNEDTARRFASMLQTAQFEALVKVATTGQVQRDDVKPTMTMRLGVTTYLADGQQYIPVFTDAATRQHFTQHMGANLDMRNFAFATAELMQEVRRLGVHGLLVNPGRQSFPLTLDYWDYITRVVPVMEAEVERVSIEALTIDKLVLSRALTRAAKRLHGVKQLWTTNVRETTNGPLALAIIADYTGTPAEFDRKCARALVVACRGLLAADQDVLIGTTADPLGQTISGQITPVYQATGFLGRKINYD